MKATRLTSVVYRGIFLSLSQYECPKNKFKLFRTRFVKRPQTKLENTFLANLDTFNSTSLPVEGSSVPRKYIYTSMPQKTLGTSQIILEKYILICLCIYLFFLFFFTINNEHIHKSFFKEFVLAFTIQFTFLEIMEALILVEHLSTAG